MLKAAQALERARDARVCSFERRFVRRVSAAKVAAAGAPFSHVHWRLRAIESVKVWAYLKLCVRVAVLVSDMFYEAAQL